MKLIEKFVTFTFYLNIAVGVFAVMNYGLIARINPLIFINLAVISAIACKYNKLKVAFIGFTFISLRVYWISLKQYNLECWT